LNMSRKYLHSIELHDADKPSSRDYLSTLFKETEKQRIHRFFYLELSFNGKHMNSISTTMQIDSAKSDTKI
jgi:hypothetical protein